MTLPHYLLEDGPHPANAPLTPDLVDYWCGEWRTRWLITDKGDLEALALADRHYTRQTPGARFFTRNGQNLVFVTADGLAVWVTFRPTPGKAVRPDKLEAWECALFRNEGPIQSSYLILEAHALTVALWGQPPPDGLITFVKPSAVRSTNPGACYKRAGFTRGTGWKTVGQSRDGKPLLKAPPLPRVDWRMWEFKHARGGKLRLELTGAKA